MLHRSLSATAFRCTAIVAVTAVLGTGLTAVVGSSAIAAPTTPDFISSFEEQDQPVSWISEPETGPDGQPRGSGVTGDGTDAMTVAVGTGPARSYTAREGVGFTGIASLRYAGTVTGAEGGSAWSKVYDVDIPVAGATELSYRIFPELTGDDLRYPSTYAAVDLVFTDGTYLSDLAPVDQNGLQASPRGQGDSKSLYANQWNHRETALGQAAAGKTIDRILVGYDSPHPDAEFAGWIDDITIAAAETVDADQPSDYVVTTRGTNSNGSFSRGNNIPATAVPHGFNFWSPVTDAGSLSWIYAYADHNDDRNRSRLQALSLSHEPSPWMGDRNTFQVMPSVAEGVPSADRQARSLPFSHDNEIASPHHYGVTFDNGLKAEIAPTDHAAVMRFTYPDDNASLVFDNVDNNGSLTIDPANGILTGFTDTRSGSSAGATRMFVYGTLDAPIIDSGKPTDTGGRDAVTGYTRLDAGEDRTVELRLATSMLSQEQAKRNLELEISPDASFDDVRGAAQAAWDDVLDVIEVEGATETQLTTLYSNLYRLSLYPNSGHENTGTADAPVWKHASPVAPAEGENTPTETGAKVVDGKIYVNNGFWDTYRTAWPAYSLLYPEKAGEMIDGFVQQYREGGWVSRWSSPGYSNIMTGTSSDISFADAYTKGITGFDAVDAYEAAVKNATVAPPGNPTNSDVGRKGLQESIFLGYTPDKVSEGVSWALEGNINDFGISKMAEALSKDESLPESDRNRYSEESKYFMDRSRRYGEMFDPSVGFFQGKDSEGNWKSTPEDYDPEEWGHDHDYTETNGWNFSFHAPHDGAGLAELYGGRDGLAEKLDTFFETPETGTKPGSYGGVIHEMIEARDVRMGMWGFSNQVSHHIPYTYIHAGQPHKTQEIVREVLSRHYTGSEIGQGYAGDEDNGETSAWWIFSALGFYPLQMADGTYAMGSPLFTKATVHLENGEDLVVAAPDNSPENVYVQGVELDGKPWKKTYLEHSDLADGGVLTFDMGPEPSRRPVLPTALPPSPSDGNVADPLTDATKGSAGFASGVAGAQQLFDDTSGTEVAVPDDGAIGFRFTSPKQNVARYTLTSGASEGDPTAWVLEGSRDGKKWKAVDSRSGQTFDWRHQTRPFEVTKPGSYQHYRLRITAVSEAGSTSLSEVELMGPQAKQLDDQAWVDETLAGIDLGDVSGLKQDLYLPTGGEFAWASSDALLITDEGRLVTRPDIGEEPVTAEMTVTVTRGEVSGTRTFTVTIAPWTQEEWDAKGTDLETSFEPGQPSALRNDWLRNEGVQEFCCGIGGMETAQGSPLGVPKTGNGILLYSGIAAGDGPSSASNGVVNVPAGTWVRPSTTMSWWVYPEAGNGRVSQFVGLDLLFTDGTLLSDLAPKTLDGASAHPRDLGEVLTTNTWQQVSVDVGAVAAGKQVQKMVMTFDSGDRNGSFRGAFDDVVLERPEGAAR